MTPDITPEAVFPVGRVGRQAQVMALFEDAVNGAPMLTYWQTWPGTHEEGAYYTTSVKEFRAYIRD